MTETAETAETAEAADPSDAAGHSGGTWLSGLQVAVLVVAVAFLVGAIAFVVGERQGEADPLNAVDVGFMQDMGLHHDQAVELSLMLIGKEGIDPNLTAFANEIIVDQRYQQGIFSAILSRYGHSPDPGEEVMGWMGQPVPAEQMLGLATPEQVQQFEDAEGEEAEALWIALMSEHHLGGLHMADVAARNGQDQTTVNIAEGIVKTQRGEILDLARYRERAGLPIPEGFEDPTQDPLMATQTTRDQVGN